MIQVCEMAYIESGFNSNFKRTEEDEREIREQWLALMYGWA